MKWKILKSQNDFVIVRAESFDEALSKARKINKDYCAGYVVDLNDECNGTKHSKQ